MIVGLDLASKTGIAFWAPGFEKPRSMVVELPTGEDWRGRAYRKLYEAIYGLHQIHGGIEKVYYEQPIPPGNNAGFTNFQTIGRLIGFVAIAELAADVMGAPAFWVNGSSWKANFLGNGRLKSAQAKRASMERCRQLGWFPQDDNAADALGILNYALTVCERVDVPWAEDLKPRATSGGVA